MVLRRPKGRIGAPENPSSQLPTLSDPAIRPTRACLTAPRLKITSATPSSSAQLSVLCATRSLTKYSGFTAKPVLWLNNPARDRERLPQGIPLRQPSATDPLIDIPVLVAESYRFQSSAAILSLFESLGAPDGEIDTLRIGGTRRLRQIRFSASVISRRSAVARSRAPSLGCSFIAGVVLRRHPHPGPPPSGGVR
jgi:hypothetical protein